MWCCMLACGWCRRGDKHCINASGCTTLLAAATGCLFVAVQLLQLPTGGTISPCWQANSRYLCLAGLAGVYLP